VAKQGYLAPNDHGAGSQVAFSYCRSLYALALMFPPKLSSHPHCLQGGSETMRSWDNALFSLAQRRSTELAATPTPVEIREVHTADPF
jgi:hypothetical protein